MSERTYSTAEVRALRAVQRREWNHDGDVTEGGPAQYAGGDYWPSELLRKANEFERLIPLYRRAASALRREIQRDRLTRRPAHDDPATPEKENDR